MSEQRPRQRLAVHRPPAGNQPQRPPFHGAPIYDSVTVVNHGAKQQAAIDFVRLLLSPQGHQLLQADGFLNTPVLVGGEPGADAG
ncbi:MAG TPA: hypothetical protein VG275_07760 [Solirubrobacteraceae bacterium]|nr:hypothetical protein [Solirubrobacteraceae bacterium]